MSTPSRVVLEMPHSGPYTTVVWDATQKILDLREDWWAIEAGLIESPDVKRIIMVNIGGQVGQSMEVVAQRVTNNEFDSALDFRQDLIASIIEQNPNVTSHTGDRATLWLFGLVAKFLVGEHAISSL